MKDMPEQSCPLCGVPGARAIHCLQCGNLDRSTLYPTVRLKACGRCGHIFNELNGAELEGLAAYYNAEYAPTNMNTTDGKGDRPGSEGRLTTERYAQLFRTLSPHMDKQSRVLDVGCAMGGFLGYLRGKGFRRLSGVDMALAYVEYARKQGRGRIEYGSAESLPFGDREMDVVVLEQVLEHLADPGRAFREAARVLERGGILCIGVPDASRYSSQYFFDYYWLLLREHIQHFDIDHLNMLAGSCGFELLEFRRTVHAVMSEAMLMPNLYAVFRLSCENESEFEKERLARQMAAYVELEKTRQQQRVERISSLAGSGRPLYAWGIGREFLYLYESAGLKSCNIAGLIDANQLKQQTCSVSGMEISDGRSALPGAPADSVLLISAVAHAGPIARDARKIGFRGEIFDWGM